MSKVIKISENDLREIIRQDLISNSDYVLSYKNYLNEAQVGVEDYIELSFGRCNLKVDPEVTELLSWIVNNGVGAFMMALTGVGSALAGGLLSKVPALGKAMDYFSKNSNNFTTACPGFYNLSDLKIQRDSAKTRQLKEEYDDHMKKTPEFNNKGINQWKFSKVKDIRDTIIYMSDVDNDTSKDDAARLVNYPNVVAAFQAEDVWMKIPDVYTANDFSKFERLQDEIIIRALNDHSVNGQIALEGKKIPESSRTQDAKGKTEEAQKKAKQDRKVQQSIRSIVESIAFFASEYLSAVGAPSIMCTMLSKMLKYLSALFNGTMVSVVDQGKELFEQAKEADKEVTEERQKLSSKPNNSSSSTTSEETEESSKFSFTREMQTIINNQQKSTVREMKDTSKISDSTIGLMRIPKFAYVSFFFPNGFKAYCQIEKFNAEAFLDKSTEDESYLKEISTAIKTISGEILGKEAYSLVISGLNGSKNTRIGNTIFEANADNDILLTADDSKITGKEIRNAVIDELVNGLKSCKDFINDHLLLAGAGAFMGKPEDIPDQNELLNIQIDTQIAELNALKLL